MHDEHSQCHRDFSVSHSLCSRRVQKLKVYLYRTRQFSRLNFSSLSYKSELLMCVALYFVVPIFLYEEIDIVQSECCSYTGPIRTAVKYVR